MARSKRRSSFDSDDDDPKEDSDDDVFLDDPSPSPTSALRRRILKGKYKAEEENELLSEFEAEQVFPEDDVVRVEVKKPEKGFGVGAKFVIFEDVTAEKAVENENGKQDMEMEDDDGKLGQGEEEVEGDDEMSDGETAVSKKLDMTGFWIGSAFDESLLKSGIWLWQRGKTSTTTATGPSKAWKTAHLTVSLTSSSHLHITFSSPPPISSLILRLSWHISARPLPPAITNEQINILRITQPTESTSKIQLQAQTPPTFKILLTAEDEDKENLADVVNIMEGVVGNLKREIERFGEVRVLVGCEGGFGERC